MTNESVDILMESYQFEEAAYLLRSLANEVRLRVITTLARVGEMSVTELQESTAVSNRFFLITLLVCVRGGSLLQAKRQEQVLFH